MEEQLEITQASVMRIIKNSLPEGVVVSKEAKLAFSRAARVFVQYLTACASDYCKGMGRQTISPNHVFGALEELEFKDFADRLTKLLEEHKSAAATRKSSKKGEETEGEEEDAKDEEVEV